MIDAVAGIGLTGSSKFGSFASKLSYHEFHSKIRLRYLLSSGNDPTPMPGFGWVVWC